MFTDNLVASIQKDINRIKVEFKDKTGLSASELAEAILIESKWNLK